MSSPSADPRECWLLKDVNIFNLEEGRKERVWGRVRVPVLISSFALLGRQ